MARNKEGRNRESYGVPITLSELKGHYEYHRMSFECFMELVDSYNQSKCKDIISPETHPERYKTTRQLLDMTNEMIKKHEAKKS